jgi:hypothetical protein
MMNIIFYDEDALFPVLKIFQDEPFCHLHLKLN